MLNIWTIYNEGDFFSARRFEIRPGVKDPVKTDDVLRSQTLEPLRNYFAQHALACMPRNAADVENIVESWL